MLKKCCTTDIQDVFDFIGPNWFLCPYLFLDLKTYAIDNKNYEMWVSVVCDKIVSVYYRYFDCLHVFFIDSPMIEDLLFLNSTICPKTIILPYFDNNTVIDFFDNDLYSIEYSC